MYHMSKAVKVIRVSIEDIVFSNGQILGSEHCQDCCESHYLSFEGLTLEELDGMLFDLDGEFFEKVDGYGIRLKPLNNHPVSVPGYGYNNGYYGTDLNLVLSGGGLPRKEFDVSECQVIEG